MNIVVLGGHGFLGQHVCRALGTNPQNQVIALLRQGGRVRQPWMPEPDRLLTPLRHFVLRPPRPPC